MKKNVSILLIVLLILVISTLVLFAEEAKYDFRKTNWGMNKSQVKQSEKEEIYYESEKSIIYKGIINGQNCMIIYLFKGDTLIFAEYVFDDTVSTEMLSSKSDTKTSKQIKSYDKPIITNIKSYSKTQEALKEKPENNSIDILLDSFSSFLSSSFNDTSNKNSWSYKSSQSKLKYNAFENKWEYAPSGSTLKYNPFENKWEFATPDESVQYNPFENKWEFASPEENTKYNPFGNIWSYESPSSKLKYNPFENKWEYAKPGSILKYNPFSNSWSYE